jgi:hypothetical protein
VTEKDLRWVEGLDVVWAMRVARSL